MGCARGQKIVSPTTAATRTRHESPTRSRPASGGRPSRSHDRRRNHKSPLMSPPTRRSPLQSSDQPFRCELRAPIKDGALHGGVHGAHDGAHCGHLPPMGTTPMSTRPASGSSRADGTGTRRSNCGSRRVALPAPLLDPSQTEDRSIPIEQGRTAQNSTNQSR